MLRMRFVGRRCRWDYAGLPSGERGRSPRWGGPLRSMRILREWASPNHSFPLQLLVSLVVHPERTLFIVHSDEWHARQAYIHQPVAQSFLRLLCLPPSNPPPKSLLLSWYFPVPASSTSPTWSLSSAARIWLFFSPSCRQLGACER